MILRHDGQLWSPPIWVDFMSLDWNGAVRLNKPGTAAGLAEAGFTLQDGLRLVLYEGDGNDENLHDDLMALGVARYDAEEGQWVAEDWEPTFHFSDLDEPARSLYRELRPQNGLPL